MDQKTLEEFARLQCGHDFCLECLKKYVYCQAERFNFLEHHIYCMECQKPLSVPDLQLLDDLDLLERIFEVRCQYLKQVRKCSNPETCKNWFYIDEEKDQQNLRCNVCSFHFCHFCMEGRHYGSCTEKHEEVLKKRKEAKEDPEALCRYQRCPWCKTPYGKTTGCNQMKCEMPYCKRDFCHGCLKKFDRKLGREEE